MIYLITSILPDNLEIIDSEITQTTIVNFGFSKILLSDLYSWLCISFDTQEQFTNFNGELHMFVAYNNWDYLPIQLSMTLHHDHHLKMIHNYYSVLKIKKYKREVGGAAPHLAPEQLLFSFWNSWSGEPKRSCSPKVTNVEGKKGGAAPEQRSKVEQKKLIKNCPKPKQILRHIFDLITS